jgi:hypothetical protein
VEMTISRLARRFSPLPLWERGPQMRSIEGG